MTASEHFDRLARRYAELRAAPAYADPLLEAVVELGELRGKRVLEVGSTISTARARSLRSAASSLPAAAW